MSAFLRLERAVTCTQNCVFSAAFGKTFSGDAFAGADFEELCFEATFTSVLAVCALFSEEAVFSARETSVRATAGEEDAVLTDEDPCAVADESATSIFKSIVVVMDGTSYP